PPCSQINRPPPKRKLFPYTTLFRSFPKLTVLYNTLEQHQTIAVVLQQMWKENLGIEVNLQNEDWKVWLASINLGNFDISRSGWGDRKSTRLNSSHVKISYAVFCLKK